MVNKPTREDDTYSDEEAAKRTDATIRAMIGMKPKPHSSPSSKGNKRTSSKPPVDKRKPRA
jgi:hypothetical protein